MHVYLLKRLVLLPLTVWLIGSVVFLLSRLVPGSYADQVAEDGQLIIGNAPPALNRTAYLNKLKAAGQDKPLFYFSIGSRAQPDTLQRVFPEQHQRFLKNLIQQYGNWPAIAHYYGALAELQQAVKAIDATNLPRQFVQQESNNLYYLVAPNQVQTALQNLHNLKARIPDSRVLAAITAVQASYANMQRSAQPTNQLLPAWSWHGHDNQYHKWLTQICMGNLGKSYRDGRPVLDVIAEAIANSLFLLLGSLLLAFGSAIQISLFLAARGHWWWNRFGLPVLYVLDSIPVFIIALLLLTLLAGSGYLKLFPLFGLGSGADAEVNANIFINFLDRLHHLVLPMLCLVLATLPYITTQLYRVMEQVKTQEFITTAWAKGLYEKHVLKRHILPNALLPLITLFTGYLPALISGALVLEIIFAIPGTGRLLADSLLARDYPVMLGLILFISAFKAAANLLADFLYFTADPRTRVAIE